MNSPTTSRPNNLPLTKQKQGPPPTQITRSYTSPYISSPMGFRKHQEPQERRKGSDVQLNSDSSQEFLSSSSQPMLIKKSSINDKETLLKASNFMGMQSSSAGPGGFKNFYSERPRSLRERALSPLVSQQAQQLEEMLSMDEKDENSDEVFEDEVSASNSMPTLAEQFEQIKSCKYIRHSKHYHPERAALEEY